ncbi:MAG: serine/threonine dehydratase [Ignavibacteria bacterium]|nr:serine/threonine dehydratase [Ignavibacteria bacterium]
MKLPEFIDVKSAAERIRTFIHQTPVLTSQSINEIAGAKLYFKCENFQKAGSFKMRGASNAVFSLPDEKLLNGVATHSSGNFAQALALAAGKRNITSYIVMPDTSPKAKSDAVRSYGGKIIFCEPTLEAREATLNKIVDETGAVFIHPYNQYDVIAGQGTAALELINEAGELDAIFAPVGGGGLLSGTSITTKHLLPNAKIIGGEPMGADDAFRSLLKGEILPSINPKTIADGLLTSLGSLTFPILRKNIDCIVTVSEEEIIYAMRLIWERMKIIVEPSAAVSLAAALQIRYTLSKKKIGIILSGGNLDLNNLPW